jgi:hypothetical protein
MELAIAFLIAYIPFFIWVIYELRRQHKEDNDRRRKH